MKKVSSVEEYIASDGQWKESLGLLREMCTSAVLEEAIQNQEQGKEIVLFHYRDPAAPAPGIE